MLNLRIPKLEPRYEQRHNYDSEDRSIDRATRAVGTVAIGALALGFLGSVFKK